MNEYEKQRKKQQLINELATKQMLDELHKDDTTLIDNVEIANDFRKDLGGLGQSMSTSNNPKLAKAGSNLYKFTGQQGLDGLKTKAYNGASNGFNTLKGNIQGFGGNANSAIGQSARNLVNGTNSASTGLSEIGKSAGNITGNAMAGTSGATSNLAGSGLSNTASKGSSVAGGAGKAMGAVGAGMNAVNSANRFAQGDTVGGGLEALKMASLAGGPWGWAIYAMAEIADMFHKAQKKKQQKAMSVAQEANAEAMMKQKEHQLETMKDNAERKAEVTNEIGDYNIDSNMPSTLDNEGETQIGTNTPISKETLVDELRNGAFGNNESEENNNTLTGRIFGDILGEMADSPTLTENLGKQVGLDLSDVNSPGTIARNMAKQAKGGVMTGGASPVDNYVDRIAELEGHLEQEGYRPEQVQGFRQGLNSGDKYIADQITRYNASKEGQANPIRIPQTEQEIELAKAGQFNPVPQQASVDEKETFKDLLMKELGGALGDFSEGFKENRSTSFAPENIMADKMADGRDKNFLNRAGEALGTLNRLATNPLVQGGLAGLAYGIDEGDALYGLGKGVEWAGNKAKSNMYAKALGQQPTVFGNIDSKDYGAMAYGDYRRGKLTQDGYLKAKKLLDDQHKNNQISDEEYDINLNALNSKYIEDTQLAGVDIHSQASNQTIDTASKVSRRDSQNKTDAQKANTQAMKANTDAKYKQLNHELAQDKLNFQKTKYSQKQMDEKINNGDLVKVSHNGKTLVIPREQLKEALKDGAKVVK